MTECEIQSHKIRPPNKITNMLKNAESQSKENLKSIMGNLNHFSGLKSLLHLKP